MSDRNVVAIHDDTTTPDAGPEGGSTVQAAPSMPTSMPTHAPNGTAEPDVALC